MRAAPARNAADKAPPRVPALDLRLLRTRMHGDSDFTKMPNGTFKCVSSPRVEQHKHPGDASADSDMVPAPTHPSV